MMSKFRRKKRKDPCGEIVDLRFESHRPRSTRFCAKKNARLATSTETGGRLASEPLLGLKYFFFYF